jgi:hypothetical protein
VIDMTWRRHVGLVGALTVLIASLVTTGPAAAAPAPSLVLRYTFQNDTTSQIHDSSSYRVAGILTNADASKAFVSGKAGLGKAVQLLAPQRQYISVPESERLDVNTFTLTAWVKYSAVVTPDTKGRWEVLEKAGAYWINVRTDGHVRAGGFFDGCGASRYWRYLDSTAVVPAQTWTHIAATYNGSRLIIYVNGAKSGSMAVTGATCQNDEPLAVGAKEAPAKGILEAFWDGQLDELRIYSRALGAAQIADLVAAAQPKSP